MFGRFKKDDFTAALTALANAPVGAATLIQGKRGVIKGTMIMDEAGDRWIEHLISDIDGRMFWVSIENYDRTVATLWEDAEIFAMGGGPDDRKVTWKSHSFKRSESGTATFTAKGDLGVNPTGTVAYVDFTGPDGMRLGFERFGEEGAHRRSRVITGTCPNCGAPVVVDAAGKCSSCSSDLMTDHGWWGEWEVAVGYDVTSEARLQ